NEIGRFIGPPEGGPYRRNTAYCFSVGSGFSRTLEVPMDSIRWLVRGLVTAVLTAALMLTAGTAVSSAQELTGTLYGKITDEAGLAVPGTTVTIKSPQLIQGQIARTTTDEGTYRVPSLPPGTYTVVAELTGFQTITRGDIAVTAGKSLAV